MEQRDVWAIKDRLRTVIDRLDDLAYADDSSHKEEEATAIGDELQHLGLVLRGEAELV